MLITPNQCADLLTAWLGKECSPEQIKEIAKNIGYNDKPFFGAEKKKILLVSELVFINSALVIFSVNQVFDADRAKSIIDPFLEMAKNSIFSYLEKKNPLFRRTYEQRLMEYFKLLRQEKPGLGLSFALLTYLKINPLDNMKAQVYLAGKFGGSLRKIVETLNAVDFGGADMRLKKYLRAQSVLRGNIKNTGKDELADMYLAKYSDPYIAAIEANFSMLQHVVNNKNYDVIGTLSANIQYGLCEMVLSGMLDKEQGRAFFDKAVRLTRGPLSFPGEVAIKMDLDDFETHLKFVAKNKGD